MIHIVICDNKTKELDKIVDGERKVLLRGSATRRIPNSRIFVNDELYFVNKGENISYYHAIVTDADSYKSLTMKEIEEVFDKYRNDLKLDKKEEEKWKKKCLCIIHFNSLEKIEGINIPKYSSLEDWIMINDIKDLN